MRYLPVVVLVVGGLTVGLYWAEATWGYRAVDRALGLVMDGVFLLALCMLPVALALNAPGMWRAWRRLGGHEPE